MQRHTDVATANVLCTLTGRAAQEALSAIVDREPDLVGLQEWGLSRRRLLRRAKGYFWTGPLLGGCPVGARADRFQLVRSSARVLGWFGRADPGARSLPLVPPRIATVAVFRDRRSSRPVSVVNFHLTPGVQAVGRYREDRPLLVARHRKEVRRLSRVVIRQLARGHTVYAVGDSNFDGLRLPGLTSAWEGRRSEPGTLGPHRKVDDVHGPGRPAAVTLLSSASDHKAVIVKRGDLG